MFEVKIKEDDNYISIKMDKDLIQQLTKEKRLTRRLDTGNWLIIFRYKDKWND